MPGNTIATGSADISARVASMRPRLDAGEYNDRLGEGDVYLICFNEAPAGCRGIPSVIADIDFAINGFNEAPAGCRGILSCCLTVNGGLLASMRPRLDAGEYGSRWRH